jgi:toxin CcdB
MPRFDLYALPGRSTGYLVDVQADLLDHLETRTVLPLFPADQAPRPIRDLNPVLEIGNRPHVLITQAIASIQRRELGRATGSLHDHRNAVTRALDLLLVGL